MPSINKTMTMLLFLNFLLTACGAAQPPAEQETEIKPDPTVPTATRVPATATGIPATATEEPPTPLPPIAAEDLHGRWGHLLFTLELNPDGSYVLGYPYHADDGEEQPRELGTYEVSNNLITFNPNTFEQAEDPIIDGCTEEDPYIYQATFTDNDARFLKLIVEGNDYCDYRAYQWAAEPVFQLMESYSTQ